MGIHGTEHQQLTVVQSKIVLTLAYFDIFRFPLLAHEILKYSKISLDEKDSFAKEVDELLKQQVLFRHGPYFSLLNQEKLEERRVNGEKNAEVLILKANKYARLIHNFPFVRSVCISGSLSKGCVDEQGDIDYFIITEPQRLWITRTLLIAFKKILLFNKHKYFCVNYFIDTEHLNIPDKNIFTATELLTLRPMSGFDVYKNLIEQNNWAFNYLPNFEITPPPTVHQKQTLIKPMLEYMFKSSFGDWLDTLLMKLTIKRWKTKFKNFNEEELDTAMRSRKYVSKHHPQQFQQVVLNRFQNTIAQVEQKLKITAHD